MYDFSKLSEPEAGPPASDASLQEAEKALGLALPEAFRRLLKQSDGVSDQEGVLVYGSEDLAERNETWEVGTYAPGFLAIGDNSGGVIALVSRSDDHAGVWVSDSGDLEPKDFNQVADSLEDWFKKGCPFR